MTNQEDNTQSRIHPQAKKKKNAQKNIDINTIKEPTSDISSKMDTLLQFSSGSGSPKTPRK
jgi:hypothetical protein